MPALLSGRCSQLQHLQRLARGSQCCTSARPVLPSSDGMPLGPRRCLQGGAGSSSYRIEALPLRQAAALQQLQLLAPLGSSRGQLQQRASGGGGGLGHGSGGGSGRPIETVGQKVMLGVAVGYMMLIVIIPFFNVFVQAFSHGMGPFVETLLEPDFQQVRSGVACALCR